MKLNFSVGIYISIICQDENEMTDVLNVSKFLSQKTHTYQVNEKPNVNIT